MNAFVGSLYYCYNCNTPYQKKNQHMCKSKKNNRMERQKIEYSVKHATVIAAIKPVSTSTKYLSAPHPSNVLSVIKSVYVTRKTIVSGSNVETAKKFATLGVTCIHQKQKKIIREEYKLIEGVLKKKGTYSEKYLFFDYVTKQDSDTHIPNFVSVHDFEGNRREF